MKQKKRSQEKVLLHIIILFHVGLVYEVNVANR